MFELETTYAVVSHKVLGDRIKWMPGEGASGPLRSGCIGKVHGLITVARRSSGLCWHSKESKVVKILVNLMVWFWFRFMAGMC